MQQANQAVDQGTRSIIAANRRAANETRSLWDRARESIEQAPAGRVGDRARQSVSRFASRVKLAASLAAGAMVTMGTRTAATLENTEIALTTIFGSADRAGAKIEEI